MKTKQLIKDIINCLETENESIKLSLNNVHADGLFSLVVKGLEPGNLTRIFIADKKLNPFDVQLHTHRYPITLTAIKGNIIQHAVSHFDDISEKSVDIARYSYKSFLNGGGGINYMDNIYVNPIQFYIPISSSIDMDETEFHTVSCSKGSIWIVEEKGFRKDFSYFLGVPFTPENLYTKPEMFQVNDKCQLVLKELKKMLKDFEC